MLLRLKFFFSAVVLLPFLISTLVHFPLLFQSAHLQTENILFFGAGCVLYILFEAVFNRPMRTYVFGHELTHALASIMMGGNVHSFKVSKEGGSVEVSKSNFFVALAPYCIPIYTLAIIIGYSGLGFWMETAPYQKFFWGLLGSSLAFHVSLTLHALRQDQPDTQKTGLFFSLVFIVLVNAWLTALLARLLLGETIAIKEFGVQVWQTQTMIWLWVFSHGKKTALWIVSKIHFD